MALFDLSAELLAFHDTDVKLNTTDKAVLAKVRDVNLERIKNGLSDLNKANFKDCRNQGGYAMETVVNDPSALSNHDIDVALIFDAADLPAGPLQARQRVRDALLKRAANFAEDPEARTNAVTVWYADGYHLDFAIYRRNVDWAGNTTYEHASTAWVARDPAEVTTWFNKTVTDQSPKADVFGAQPKVRKGQLRRIVRLVKWFSRSRSSWDLPGGMIISALVVECYRPDRNRDDIALYNTLSALKTRLEEHCRVYHPLGGARELTGADKYLKEVGRLKEHLATHVPKLAVLSDPACTRLQARSAWDWIFNHPYWGGQEVLAEAAALKSDEIHVGGHTVAMVCKFTGRGGKAKPYKPGVPLPRGLGLEFAVTTTTVPSPYDIRYEVKNTGEEARTARNLEWAGKASSYTPTWTTSTAYAGRHRMTANIVKNGVTLASTSMIITIAGRGVWGGVRR